ncbi:MAG: tetraacyldisaccharide 4'-kinase [Rhodothermaceae bacterium]
MLKLIKILSLPLSLVYRGIIEIRNSLFEKGINKTESVAAKVISVGNLTVGGSGKTPTVIYLTKLIKSFEKNAGVLSRGYLRKSKGYLLVSDGNKIQSDIEKCGDEIFLTAQECKAPAAVCERRVEGARRFLQDVKLDAIVLDDAYQHRWIERDLNILVFDQRFLQKHGQLDQNLLPSGLMREPFKEIKRADVVLINRKFSEYKPIPEALSKYFSGKTIFNASYKATGIVDIKTGKTYSLDEFKGQKSLVISGIARPYSFLSLLEQISIDIKNKILFPDHKNYTEKEVEQIRKEFYKTNSYSVLTTQKDAVKLSNFSKQLDDIDIYYLKIELVIEHEKEFNDLIFNIFNN